MFMESMEQRSLLSAALASGVLTVTGTDANDAITVYTKGTQIIVSEFALPDPPVAGSAPPTTPPTFPTPTVTKFTATDVTSIIINAGAGNDAIMIGKHRDGQLTLGVTANGEAGNDRIHGGSGNDTLSGGAGKDRIFGADGDDLINGDANNDKLDGGKGVDTLIAGTGNDFIFSADSSADVIDGGLNDTVTEDTEGDVAVIDALDVSVTGVEKSTTITPRAEPSAPTTPTTPTTPGDGTTQTTPTTPGKKHHKKHKPADDTTAPTTPAMPTTPGDDDTTAPTGGEGTPPAGGDHGSRPPRGGPGGHGALPDGHEDDGSDEN